MLAPHENPPQPSFSSTVHFGTCSTQEAESVNFEKRVVWHSSTRFNREARSRSCTKQALNLLRWCFPTANDFGSEIIPASAKEIIVKAYLFNDYWEDIGTIKSFFEANLDLVEQPPRFSFYDANKPTYASRRNLPPSMLNNSKSTDSIISHGCFLDNCWIEHSVVGIRSRIGSNVHLKDTVMLGADFYETDVERGELQAEEKVPIGIGENTKIQPTSSLLRRHL